MTRQFLWTDNEGYAVWVDGDGDIAVQDTTAEAPIYFTPDQWRQIVNATRSVWEEPHSHPQTQVTVTPNVTLGWHTLKGH